MDLTLIIFASGVVFGGACSIVAANKSRDPLVWFVLGFLFSLVALIVIAALSSAGAENERPSGRAKQHDNFGRNSKDPERPWLG